VKNCGKRRTKERTKGNSNRLIPRYHQKMFFAACEEENRPQTAILWNPEAGYDGPGVDRVKEGKTEDACWY